MDDNDLLYSNSYNPAKESQGYGLTDELKRFKLRDHIEKQGLSQSQSQSQSQTSTKVDEKMFVNDLLNTNRVVNEKGELNPINTRTTFKEVRYVYSINSNERNQYIIRSFETPSNYQLIFSTSGYTLFESIFNFYTAYRGFIGVTADNPDFLIYKTTLAPLYNAIVNTNAPIFYSSITTETNFVLNILTFIVTNGVGIITFPLQPGKPFEIGSLIILNDLPLNGGTNINNQPFTVTNCTTAFVEFSFSVDYPDYEWNGVTLGRPTLRKEYKNRSTTDYTKNKRFLVEIQFAILDSFRNNFAFLGLAGDTIAKIADLLIIAQWLNILVSTSDFGNKKSFWQPFFVFEGVIQEYINDQTENNYSITLPDYIQNCKSIRLLSCEVPNTIPNITESNNVLFLSIARDVLKGTTSTRVSYLPISLLLKNYNYQLLQLNVGQYTVKSLLAHMEEKLNEELKGNWFNASDTSDVIVINPDETFFKITFTESTGKISISLNSIDNSFTFHLKFYSNQLNTGANPPVEVPTPVVPDFDELWYKLGFPWPSFTSNNGTNIYQNEVTNCIDNVHMLLSSSFPTDDIICSTTFNQSNIFTVNDIVGRKLIEQNNDNRYQRPFRYPIMTRTNYVYLAIRGFKNIKNVLFDKNNEVYDLFAKILLNVPAGAMAYNTYVDNPWVFTDVHDTKISKLEFQWVDHEGLPVDFSGANHSFTLEFITYVSNADVNAYNTKLGIIDKSSYPEYLTGNKPH
jgi:hypothetical protein